MRWLAAAMMVAGPAGAAEPAGRIVVTGTGVDSTPPTVATIAFRVTGEGATSDAAVAAMAARQRAIAAAVGAGEPPRAGDVAVASVRGPDCRRDDGDDAPRLSSGKCAVVGYLATLTLRLRTATPREAGTVVGLLGRMGADNPGLEGFALADPAPARGRALAAALADARARAQAIAAATGARLGRLLVASTEAGERGEDIVVTGSRLAAPAAMSPPPIVVDLTPQPIETRAQVTVTYAIAP